MNTDKYLTITFCTLFVCAAVTLTSWAIAYNYYQYKVKSDAMREGYEEVWEQDGRIGGRVIWKKVVGPEIDI